MREQRINRQNERRWTWSKYFVYVYEGRTIKPVEILLRRGEVMRENDVRGESNQGGLQVYM
jgi:hypothetical protein